MLQLKNTTIKPPSVGIKGFSICILLGLAYSALYALLLYGEGSISASGMVFNTLIRFSIKFILLALCWWIIFRILHERRVWLIGVAHIILGVSYSLSWFYSYSLAYVLYLGIDLTQSDTFIGFPYWIALTALFEYMLVFSVFHIFYSYRSIRFHEMKSAELRNILTQKQISTLKAQLNPHFLFNTLNSINAMAGISASETREMVTKLSGMLRYSMRSFEEEQVSIREELSFVKMYLDLEKHRLGDRLAYDIDVDDHLLEMEISPMIIQPLVENAIKHGIAPKPEGGSIEIRIKEREGHIRVSVRDTGYGIADNFDIEESKGVGAKNIHKYLIESFGPDYGLYYQQVKSGGTKVVFKMPVEDI